MRIFLLAAVFAIGTLIAAQTPGTPDNPFPNHEVPPKDWYCWPANANHDPATDEHACTCLGMQEHPDPDKMCQRPPQPEGSGVEYPDPNDNNKCKVWCHKDKCACATQCEFSTWNKILRWVHQWV